VRANHFCSRLFTKFDLPDQSRRLHLQQLRRQQHHRRRQHICSRKYWIKIQEISNLPLDK
jgi:hypothetical protein